MFVKCKQQIPVTELENGPKSLNGQFSNFEPNGASKKPKMKTVETLSIHMIKNLKNVYKRNFEVDSGISIKYLDYQPFQMIEFCFDRVLIHLFDQILIYDISQDFQLKLLKNVQHFGSGFCGSAFFVNKEVILMMFSLYVARYNIEENVLER